MNRTRLKSWSLTFGFWTLMALLSALSNVMDRVSSGVPAWWCGMLLWAFLSYWLWMLLVPVVAQLGRATAKHGWIRFFLVHIPAGFAIAVSHQVVVTSVFWAWHRTQMQLDHTLGQELQGELMGSLFLSMIVYWFILVVLRSLESRRLLQDEQLRSAQLESQLTHSQLQALRMQLQPHFLFNTLNAISALALADPQQAREMISRLSDMLRITLEERNSQMLPLSRELDFVRSYLDIQQIRFRDRLDVCFDVDDDTLDAEVPSMLLQPLVENALRHGLLAKPTRGTLCIAARIRGGLLLSVDDDGVGLPVEGVKEGVGLGNTRTRLEMLFGSAAWLRMRARENGGTRVEVRLPFRKAAPAGAA